MRLALTVLALLAASPAAADALPHFAQDMLYTTVRKKLIAMGYKPHHAPDADKCTPGESTCFPEIEACAGTGLGNCNFQWEKDGHIIVVSTIGDPPTFSWIDHSDTDKPR